MHYLASPTTRRPSFRPRLEALEERCVPSAGELDTTFGSGGIVDTVYVTTSAYGREEVAIYPNSGTANDGKIVLAVDIPQDFTLGRYNPNGSLDSSFGSGGKVFTDFGNGRVESSYAVAIQSDGKVLAGGAVHVGRRGSSTFLYDWGLVRYNTNGTVDTTFGGKAKGKLTLDLGGDNEGIDSLFVQPDGRILAVGWTSGGIALVRYTSNGTLDTSFGSGGKVISSFPATYEHFAALQADGKILVRSYASNGGTNDLLVARYTSAGALDSAFGTGGTVSIDLGSTDDEGTSIAVYPNLGTVNDGKIVVGAYVKGTPEQPSFALVRYNTNGNLDVDSTNGFGSVVPSSGLRTGLVSYDFSSSHIGFYPDDLVIQNNGKIVATESTTARFMTDGSVDTSFNSAGANPGVADWGGRSLALQADGKVVIANNVGLAGTTAARLVRLQGDPVTAPAAATSTVLARQAAADQFFADLRAVSLLLSNEDTKKH